MPDKLEQSTAALSEARARGEPDALAEALVGHANELVLRGRIAEACQELDEAAALHRTRDRPYDEARCNHLAASLYRLGGQLDVARQRAQAALALVSGQGPAAVAAHAELGEIALAEGNSAAAATDFTAALDLGTAQGLKAAALATLLHHRAQAVARMGDYTALIADLHGAAAGFDQAGDHKTRLRVQVELASAFQDQGQTERAEEVIGAAWPDAERAGEHAILADLGLLRAAQALARRDGDAALGLALQARREALAGNAPGAYIGAAVTLAQLYETSGNRAAAYEALAVGWATLSDLLGPDLARQAFQPSLLACRQRWGTAAFDAIKQDYEARRKTLREEDAP